MQVSYHPCPPLLAPAHHYCPCPQLSPLPTHSVADPFSFQIFVVVFGVGVTAVAVVVAVAIVVDIVIGTSEA